jgi:hypothetical protein
MQTEKPLVQKDVYIESASKFNREVPRPENQSHQTPIGLIWKAIAAADRK